MKNILYIIIAALLFSFASCEEIDNWEEPGARMHGNIIDSYTGENLVMDNNDWQIRIIDRTWEENNPGAVAQYQTLAVKSDGVYNNSKLFSGVYDMLPYDGPFWPVDTVKGVVLDGVTQQDFTVTPYLQLSDFTATLDGTDLTLKCTVKAPVTVDLPDLYEVWGFLSHTTFCGNSNKINIPEYNDLRAKVKKSWEDEVGDADSKEYTLGPFPVKSGYTYHVRMGANVDVLGRKFNYSEIVEVVVP